MGVKNVVCKGVEFVKLSRDVQYSGQQMHLIKDNKIQTVKQFMVSPLHVSALECRLQGLYEHKSSQIQHSTSRINLPRVINA
jgi:hypothetical protein